MAHTAADGFTGAHGFPKNWSYAIAPGPQKPFTVLSATATSGRHLQGRSNSFNLLGNMAKPITAQWLQTIPQSFQSNHKKTQTNSFNDNSIMLGGLRGSQSQGCDCIIFPSPPDRQRPELHERHREVCRVLYERRTYVSQWHLLCTTVDVDGSSRFSVLFPIFRSHSGRMGKKRAPQRPLPLLRRHETSKWEYVIRSWICIGLFVVFFFNCRTSAAKLRRCALFWARLFRSNSWNCWPDICTLIAFRKTLPSTLWRARQIARNLANSSAKVCSAELHFSSNILQCWTISR